MAISNYKIQVEQLERIDFPKQKKQQQKISENKSWVHHGTVNITHYFSILACLLYKIHVDTSW